MSDAPAAAAPASAAAADAAGSSSSAAAAPAAAAGAAAAAPAATTGGTKKKGKGKKEEVLEVDPNFEGQKYRIGELIYANYAESVLSHTRLAAARAAQVSSAGRFHASDFADIAWLRMCMTSCARRGKQWFEAKVLKVEKRQGKIYYYLHYNGQPDTCSLSTLTRSRFPCGCTWAPSV